VTTRPKVGPYLRCSGGGTAKQAKATAGKLSHIDVDNPEFDFYVASDGVRPPFRHQQRTGEILDITDIVEHECAWFSVTFATEIAALNTCYGLDNVLVRWGAIGKTT
jgi:hypothetical protein